MSPTEQHLRVLRNLAAGKTFQDGFVHQENAMRAMFQCLLNGWVSRNQLTEDGRAVLTSHTPVKGNFEITIIPSRQPSAVSRQPEKKGNET